MIVLSSNQPCYMPWYGFIERVSLSTHHLVADTNQYAYGNDQVQNRNRILKPEGVRWLTVPIKRHQGFKPINQTLLGKTPWQENHKGALKAAYLNSPYYSKFIADYETLIDQDWETLADLNIACQELMLRHFDVSVKFILKSEMPHIPKENYHLNLCKELDADCYIANSSSEGKIDEAAFERAGIGLIYHKFDDSPYTQQAPGFTPNLSAVDRLFNTGTRKTIQKTYMKPMPS